MKKIINYILLIVSIILIGLPLIIKINEKDNTINLPLEEELNNLMKSYCEEAYKGMEEQVDIYLSLKDMEEVFNFDISKFKEKCSLENSFVKAYISDGKLVCENDLKCDFGNTELEK